MSHIPTTSDLPTGGTSLPPSPPTTSVSEPQPTPSTSLPTQEPTTSSPEPPPETTTTLPPTTFETTSVVPPTSDNLQPSTVIVTLTSTPTPEPTTDETPTHSSSSANPSPTVNPGGANGKPVETHGLTAGAKTAIAVVVPVVVVALLVFIGIVLWRKRKARKNAEEARRKEIEEYGFNPNHDPTLPTVAGTGDSEMGENQSGYRGWGTTTAAGTASHRKTSTTVSGGAAGAAAFSDNGSAPGGYRSPGSAEADGYAADPNTRRETLDSETIGELGAGPVASANANNVRRGPSNASSSYSAGQQSDGDAPIPVDSQQYYDNGHYNQNSYDVAYSQQNGGGAQPVIRDVSARRNTRIESPSVWPQQGNSGIAQNF